jgi:hypothetical protein
MGEQDINPWPTLPENQKIIKNKQQTKCYRDVCQSAQAQGCRLYFISN